jgi:hypothetical protein
LIFVLIFIGNEKLSVFKSCRNFYADNYITDLNASNILTLHFSLVLYSYEDDINVPDDRNFVNAIIKKSGEKANDLTYKEYLNRSDNPALIKLGELLGSFDEFPLTSYLAIEDVMKEFYKPGSMHSIVGGFDSLTSAIVEDNQEASEC